MPCGCKKLKGEICYTCSHAILAGSTGWMDCDYWSGKEELPVLTKGQYVKYTDGSVRVKPESKCEFYEPKV